MFPYDGPKKQLDTSSSSTMGEMSTQYSSYTPLKNEGNESKTLRKHLLKRLERREFLILTQEFKKEQFSQEFIKQFLDKEYYYIFNWLLMVAQETRSFELVLELFPHEVLKEQLRKNNFQLLNEFLAGRKGMEKYFPITEALNTLDQERFRLLLRLDPKGVQDYMNMEEKNMKENQKSSSMCASSLKNYKIALETFVNQKYEKAKAS